MDNFSKDFDKWNELKKKLHVRDERILFHEREIWWCSLGVILVLRKMARMKCLRGQF